MSDKKRKSKFISKEILEEAIIDSFKKPYGIYTKCWCSLYEWDLLEAAPTDHGTFTLSF